MKHITLIITSLLLIVAGPMQTASATDISENVQRGVAPGLTFEGPSATQSFFPVLSGRIVDVQPEDLPLIYVQVVIGGRFYEADIAEDNASWSFDPSTNEVSLEEGINGLKVSLLDADEDVSELDFEVTVDQEAPGITLDGPTLTNEASPTLKGRLLSVNTLDLPLKVEIQIGQDTYPAEVDAENTEWFVDLLTAANGEPVKLSEGANLINAFVTDAAGNRGGTESDGVFVDTVKPDLTIENEALTNNPQPDLEGTIGEDLPVFVEIEGFEPSEAEVGDGMWFLTAPLLKDGAFRVSVSTEDAAGNRTIVSQILTVDTEAPELTYEGPTDTNDVSPTLKGQILGVLDSDLPLQVQVQIVESFYDPEVSQDNGSWILELATADDGKPLILGEGPNSMAVLVRDAAQNAGRNDFTVNVDTRIPEVTIESETLVTTSQPRIHGTVNEQSIVRVKIGDLEAQEARLSDGTWELPSAQVSELADDLYSVEVTATDPAGNVGTARQELKVNTTAPGITFSGPMLTNVASPTIAGTITGVIAVDLPLLVEVELFGSFYEADIAEDNASWSLDLLRNEISLEEGENALIVRVTDVAKNSTELPFRVNLDQRAPGITLDGPTLTNEASPTLKGRLLSVNTSDLPLKVEIQIGQDIYPAEVDAENTEWFVDLLTAADGEPVKLSEGANLINAFVTDAAGNRGGTESDGVFVDTVKPDLTIENETLTNNPQPNLEGTIGEDLPVFVEIEGFEPSEAEVGDGMWFLTTPLLKDGAFRVSVSTEDAAGNRTIVSQILTVDTEAPELTYEGPTDTNDVSPTLKGQILGVLDSDLPLQVQVQIVESFYDPEVSQDNGSWILELATADDGKPLILGEGPNSMAVLVHDAAQNAGRNDFTVNVDTRIPEVTIESETLVTTSQPRIHGTVNEQSIVRVKIGDLEAQEAVLSDGTWELPSAQVPELADDLYSVEVTATDPAGNVGTARQELTVNTTAPGITFSGPMLTNVASPTIAGTITGVTQVDLPLFVEVEVLGSSYEADISEDNTVWSLDLSSTNDESAVILEEGENALTVSVGDAAKNTTELLFAVTVDQQAPVITVDPLTSSDPTPLISGTVDDPVAIVTVQILQDVFAATNDDGKWTLQVIEPLTDGTYDLVAQAIDVAGNVGMDASQDELVLSGTASIPAVTVDMLSTFDRSPALSGTVDDENATVVLVLDGTSYNATNNRDGTWMLADDVVSLLDVGAYDVQVTATSVAGLDGTDNTGDELTILPASVTLNEAQDVSATSFSIQWTNPEGGVVSYLFDLSTSSEFASFEPAYEARAVDTNELLVTGLDYNSTFFARVRAVYGSGDISEISNVIIVKTITDPGTASDSLALVTIYNATSGENWSRNENWLSGRLSEWSGVTQEEARVVAIDLSSNGLRGSVPSIDEGLEFVADFNLADNELTDIQSLSSLPTTANVDVSGNSLQFAALQRLVTQVATVGVDKQGLVLDEIVTLEEQGTTYVVDREVGGVGNVYRWFRNDELIAATESQIVIEINSFDQEGTYFAEVTNPDFPGLVLTTRQVVLKVSSLERDRLALLNIFTATSGADWTNGADWPDNPNIETWTGVTVANNRVTQLDLASSNVSGAVPEDLLDIVSLEFLDLSGNAISGIPDLRSLLDLTAPNVSDNLLDFGDLEGNAEIPSIDYSNQRPFDRATEVRLPKGSDHTLTLDIGGTANKYMWSFTGVTDARTLDAENGPSLEIADLNHENMGDYTLVVTNQLVPDLELRSEPQSVLAVMDIQLRPVYDTDENNPTALDQGEALLFKVGTGGPFDTLGIANVEAAGVTFSDVVLGDYLLLVRPDTLIVRDQGGRTDSIRLLPTYFRSTFLWEEADVLMLRDAVNEEMVMQRRPQDVEVGENMIDLLVESDFGSGGGESRLTARRTVKRAGCSLRRRRRATGGREANDEIYDLIAYKETDDNGRVMFDDLPDGFYRLNIEFPGVPMDPSSFIEFEIGEGGLEENSLTLEATVDELGISVELIEALSTGTEDLIDLSVFPNPVSEMLFIQYEIARNGPLTIELLDLQGRIVRQADTTFEGKLDLDVRSLPTGMYLLRFLEKGGHSVLRSGRVLIRR